MLARKLKLKPKPIPGNNLRRTLKDNDEVSTVSAIRTNENEPIASGNTVDKSNESEISSKITNSTVEADKISLNEELIVVEVSQEEKSQKQTSESTIQVNDSIPTSVIENSIPIVKTGAQLPQELNDSSCKSSMVDCDALQNPSFNEPSNVTEPKAIATVPVKAETAKGLSRFGRSRCKPVLTANPRRSATRVSNESEELETSQVAERTKSVIEPVLLEPCRTPEPNTIEVNSVSRERGETYFEDGYNRLEPTATGLNSIQSKTNELAACQASTPVVASNSTAVISNLNVSPLKGVEATENDSKEFDTLNDKPTPTKIANSPVKAALQLSENAKEVELLHGSKSVPTPKIPLSPLRATSKIFAPKPTPLLRDGVRRISFQGSDSEEDLKRKKDSITKIKDKQGDVKMTAGKRKKSQGSTFSKMSIETLEKFYQKFGKDKKPDKSKLTMIDLIFYNPKDNPMSKTQQQLKAQTFCGKKEIKSDISEEIIENLDEQNVDDVHPAQAMPVPQLKIGPDGQVMLDPKSLVIETTGTEKGREELEKSEVIQESGITRYSTYSKRKPRRSCWTSVETLQFYKALSTIGPDFTLMTQLFPKRDRHDLKLKFKKEDKLNRELIDKAMTGHVDFDFDRLQEEIKQENEEIEKKRIELECYEKQKIEEKHKDIAERKQMASIKKEYKNKNIKNTRRRRKRKIPCSQELADTDDSTTDEDAKKCQEVALAKRASLRRPELKKLKESVKVPGPKLKTEFGLMKAEAAVAKKTGSKSRTLNEVHEMNETLKKDLCSQPDIKKIPDSESDDRYTPNGLFESPKLTEDDGHLVWTIDVSSVPPIEETVLRGGDNSDMEAVSEISGLGSFGQDSNSALDLSVTALDRRPLLDRRIIAESMEIVGQLTSHVEDKDPLEIEKVLPLPSFETVIGMRSPFRHLVEAADYLETSTLPEESRVEFRTNTGADRLGVNVGVDQSEVIPDGFQLSEMISQSEQIIPEMIPQSEKIIPGDSEQSGMILEESESSEIIHGGSEHSEKIPGDRETSVMIPGGSENSVMIPTGSEHIEIITRSREYGEMILGD